MELKQIEYFLHLAKMQHMSHTAEFLNISQPTLSKSLNTLERDLGVPLFDRVGNHLELNDSGRQFYTKAQQAMQVLNSAVLSAKQASYEVSGEVTIVCLSFAPILVPCVSAYMGLNPKVNIRLLHFNHILSSSGEVDYDFILTANRYNLHLGSSEKLWTSVSLFYEHFYLAIGPAHPMFDLMPEHDKDFRLSMLSDASFVVMREDNNYTDFSYKLCLNAGFEIKSYFQTDDFMIKMNIIREGKCVAFLPHSCLEQAHLLCPGMREFCCPSPISDRTIQIMRKPKKLLNEASQDFWDFLLDYYHLPPDRNS